MNLDVPRISASIAASLGPPGPEQISAPTGRSSSESRGSNGLANSLGQVQVGDRPPRADAIGVVPDSLAPVSAHQRALRTAIATSAALGAALWLSGTALAATPATGGFHDTTIGESEYVVAAGVTELQVNLVAGTGGTSQDSSSASNSSTPGGAAGTVQGLLAVHPGEVLYLEVGANGASASGVGAVGGGGAGGATYPGSSGYTVSGGGGGGGATSIQTCSTATCNASTFGTASDPRLVVAGGGGGAGDLNADTGGFGGRGGNPAYPGSFGLSGLGYTTLGGPGSGGTATIGGQGGVAGSGLGGVDDGSPGSTGGPVAGGSGGSGSTAGGAGGGGGGGGYYAGGGGGGGGLGNGGLAGLGAGGGGGGGESYAGPSLTSVSFGTLTGSSPSITISYPTTTTLSITPSGSGAAGAQVTVTAEVASVDGGHPTGSVTIALSRGAGCTATLAQGIGSCQLTLPSAGSLTATGTYSGDTTYSPSKGQLAYAAAAAVPVPATGSGPATAVGLASLGFGVLLALAGGEMRRRRRLPV